MTDPIPPSSTSAGTGVPPVPPTLPRSPEAIIRGAAKTAGFVGVPGALLPHLDATALILLWADMIRQLATAYGLKITWLDSVKMAVAIAGSIGAFGGGIKAANWFFGLTGFGTVPALAANVSLNTAVTYTVGKGIAEVFAKKDTDIGSFLASLTREVMKLLPTAATFGPRIFMRSGHATIAS